MILRRALAAAQTVPVPGDVRRNLEEHVELARVAAAEGASVVVFPELSLTGYELDRARDLALTVDDPRLGSLLDAAVAFSITLVVGGPVSIGDELFIGSFILSPRRNVEIYTKQHLGAFPPTVNPGASVPPPEASVFTPGDRNPLVRIDEHTAALAICADTGRPSHAEAAARRGAEIYLASAFVIPADFEGDTARLEGYAARHSMAVVFANFGGPSGGLPAAGRSAIWSERGRRVVQLDALGAGLAIAIQDADGWRAKAVMLGARGVS